MAHWSDTDVWWPLLSRRRRRQQRPPPAFETEVFHRTGYGEPDDRFVPFLRAAGERLVEGGFSLLGQMQRIGSSVAAGLSLHQTQSLELVNHCHRRSLIDLESVRQGVLPASGMFMEEGERQHPPGGEVEGVEKVRV